MSAVTASVLTVEDDPIVRADLRLVLEDAGFSVCAGAGDGVEAIELAREHEPDVILLDLGLPRLNGVEATRRILAERDVPIVALTGRSRRLAEEALDAGAHSYVLKPFAEEEVVGKLIDALAARESLTIRGASSAGSRLKPARRSTSSSQDRAAAAWPLRIRRASDGSLDVTALPDEHH